MVHTIQNKRKIIFTYLTIRIRAYTHVYINDRGFTGTEDTQSAVLGDRTVRY